MSRNRSSGTRATEQRFRSLLVRSGINGWKLGHGSGLVGKPDFIFMRRRIAIFLDGCFWHGCKRCRTVPEANHTFWAKKIMRNRKRDKNVLHLLQAKGWKVMRVWEHELRKNRGDILQKVIDLVKS
jgi:DNA mismatch endonuclease (patch repair protein)